MQSGPVRCEIALGSMKYTAIWYRICGLVQDGRMIQDGAEICKIVLFVCRCGMARKCWMLIVWNGTTWRGMVRNGMRVCVMVQDSAVLYRIVRHDVGWYEICRVIREM